MKFIPGIELSGYFFDDAIQPILRKFFPNLPYSAARLGWGSDVMGFDTTMSMDHGWGPKLTLYLREVDYAQYQAEIDEVLANNLPFQVKGFPTNFGEPFSDGGKMDLKEDYPIHHMVIITTPERFFHTYLGVDLNEQLTPDIWLTIPQQKLFTVRSGKIFHDGLGTLETLRQRFHWYSHDIWYYLMANQWQRISQDEPFVGRAGSVGDDLGSRLLTARLIYDLMRLAFLIERSYAPYGKWFGTAFNQLKLAKHLLPIFQDALESKDWQTREAHLADAYVLLAHRHNELRLTSIIRAEVSKFHQRPFMVLHSDRFVDALLEKIEDPAVRALPARLGSIDQIVDNTDVLEQIPRCQKLRILYEESKE